MSVAAVALRRSFGRHMMSKVVSPAARRTTTPFHYINQPKPMFYSTYFSKVVSPAPPQPKLMFYRNYVSESQNQDRKPERKEWVKSMESKVECVVVHVAKYSLKGVKYVYGGLSESFQFSFKISKWVFEGIRKVFWMFPWKPIYAVLKFLSVIGGAAFTVDWISDFLGFDIKANTEVLGQEVRIYMAVLLGGRQESQVAGDITGPDISVSPRESKEVEVVSPPPPPPSESSKEVKVVSLTPPPSSESSKEVPTPPKDQGK